MTVQIFTLIPFSWSNGKKFLHTSSAKVAARVEDVKTLTEELEFEFDGVIVLTKECDLNEA